MAGRLRIWLALGPRFLNKGAGTASVSMMFDHKESAGCRSVFDMGQVKDFSEQFFVSLRRAG